MLTFHYAIILINSFVNKNYNVFLEKGFYKDKSDTQYFKLIICR